MRVGSITSMQRFRRVFNTCNMRATPWFVIKLLGKPLKTSKIKNKCHAADPGHYWFTRQGCCKIFQNHPQKNMNTKPRNFLFMLQNMSLQNMFPVVNCTKYFSFCKTDSCKAKAFSTLLEIYYFSHCLFTKIFANEFHHTQNYGYIASLRNGWTITNLEQITATI